MAHRLIITLAVLLALPGAAAARSPESAEAVLDAFRAALEAGDRAAALSYLAPELIVYEGGNIDAPRSAYEGHHLGGDIAFHVNVASKRLSQTRLAGEGLVTLLSEYRQTGSFRGMAINAHVTETAVLKPADDGWKILHLHWSSRMVRPESGDQHE